MSPDDDGSIETSEADARPQPPGACFMPQAATAEVLNPLRAFAMPPPGTPWWQTAKGCGAWTDRLAGDVGCVHFGSTEALRVYSWKLTLQAEAAAATAARQTALLQVIHRLNGSTYNLTKAECIAEVQALLDGTPT